MALKAILTKTDYDALPDLLKEQYGAADNDTYVLDADIEAHPRAGALKNALEKERKSAKTIDAEYKALKEQLGDLDPVKARDAHTKLQELLEKQAQAGKTEEEQRKAHVEALNKAHAAEIKARDTKLDEITKSYTALDRDHIALVLDGAIRDESLLKGVRKEYLPDVIYRLKEYGVEGVKWRLDEKRAIVATAGEDIKYGKDGVSPMPISEGLESLRKTNPLYFEPSGGGGAHNSARQEGNRFVMAESEARNDHGKWKAAKAAAVAAGHELVLDPSR